MKKCERCVSLFGEENAKEAQVSCETGLPSEIYFDESTPVIVLPEGYNEHTSTWYAAPVAITRHDNPAMSDMVKLCCSMSGYEYATRWITFRDYLRVCKEQNVDPGL